MDYARVYDQFIQDRKVKQSDLEVFEIHHIVPRCLGGGDEKSNLIRLSRGDHLFAHILLARIHGGRLAMAARMMLNMSRYAGRRSRLRYEWLRAEQAKAVSKALTGYEHSAVSKANYKIGAKRRFSDPEKYRKHCEAVRCKKRKPRSSEHSRKLAEAARKRQADPIVKEARRQQALAQWSEGGSLRSKFS